MRYSFGVACTVLSVLFGTSSLVAQSLPAAEYGSIDKPLIGSLRPGFLQDLRRATNDIGRGFALIASIENPAIDRIDRIVGRVDILYERDGAAVESNFCTATAIRDLLVTARHCIPGPPPERAARAKFTTKYYYDGQSKDDRTEIVLDGNNVHKTDLDFVAITFGKTVIEDVPPLFYRAPIQDETVLLVSHPLGQGKRLSVGQCKVLYVNPPPMNNFVHTCATLEGSSGALLFGKSDGSILGMHVQGFETGNAINIVDIVAHSPELSTRLIPAGPPKEVDTSGWPLTEADFVRYIGAALRSRSPAVVFDSILSESTPSRGIAGLSLYRISVRAGSVPALDNLRSRGITLAPGDKRVAVRDAIELIDHGGADRTLLTRVLDDGGEIWPDDKGIMPECGEHSSEVMAVMRERGRKCTS
jgi:Trypsin-like peptidase domain